MIPEITDRVATAEIYIESGVERGGERERYGEWKIGRIGLDREVWYFFQWVILPFGPFPYQHFRLRVFDLFDLDLNADMSDGCERTSPSSYASWDPVNHCFRARCNFLRQ